MVLGVEFSGQISELGPGVSGWKLDDEVMGLAGGGAYAEYIVVAEGNIIKKPTRLSWVDAASIPENFLTAFQALVVYGEVKKGENVLVHAGASGVGIAAIQLARVYGALTVTATASTQEKLDWLLSIPNGATNAANYKTQNFAEEVKKVTGGNGADVIIDFVGQSHWNHNIDALAVDGRMTMLSFLSGKHACVKIVLIMETVHPFRSDSSFGEPRPNSIQAPSDYRLYSSVPLSCLSGRPHRTIQPRGIGENHRTEW